MKKACTISSSGTNTPAQAFSKSHTLVVDATVPNEGTIGVPYGGQDPPPNHHNPGVESSLYLPIYCAGGGECGWRIFQFFNSR